MITLGNMITLLVFSILVIVSSGLCSSAEAALLSSSEVRARVLARQGTKGQRLLNLLNMRDKSVAAIVILNNISNIVGSIIIGAMASRLFDSRYMAIFSFILTVNIIIFAEILPKNIGSRLRERMAIAIATPLSFFTYLLTPLILLTEFLSRLIPVDSKYKIIEDEIKVMADLGLKEGIIKRYESEIIKRVFTLDETYISQIMVPRHKMVSLSIEESFAETLKKIKESGYTRFPLMEEGEIVGIINVKDIFLHTAEHNLPPNLKKIARPVRYIPESMKVGQFLSLLKTSHIHMTIVVNEYGDLIGLVTLEDALELFVGDIEDEFDIDLEALEIKKLGEGRYIVSGVTELKILKESLGLNIEAGHFRTVNGLFIYKLQRIPIVGDELSFPWGKIKVVKAGARGAIEAEIRLN